MRRKKSYPTMTDQFCGAGGSGQGATAALQKFGGEVTQALNHWKLATDTYQTNFKSTRVYCTDISACDPRNFESTDGLCTSPECTTHTPAGGNTHRALKKQMDLFEKQVIDPATERSRATMWDVCRFAEYHQYNFIIVENVIEAKTRWPLFDTWLQAMHVLGYNHKCVYRNSMHHHPTPQSRDRMYVVFWKKGNKAPKLDYMPEAFCYKCAAPTVGVQSWKNPEKKYGKYGQQYVYRCHKCNNEVTPYYYAAFNCIDWSDRGTRIGDRELKQHYKNGKLQNYKGETWLPLSPNTLTRIEHGRKKYGNQILQVTNKNPGFCKPITKESGTVLTVNGHSLFIPFVQLNEHANKEPMTRGVHEVLQSQLTRQTMGIAFPPFVVGSDFNHNSKVRDLLNSFSTRTTHQSDGIVMPWIIEMNRTGECKPAQHPTSTVTAGGINHAIFHSFITMNKGQSLSREISEALSTVTCNEYLGLLTEDALNSFLAYNYGGTQTSHITEAHDAVATKEHSSLIGQQSALEDCYYRMLKPKEIKLAMGFLPDYQILGCGKDQVKQCGNAVTPSTMEWFTERCLESLN